MKDKVGEMLAKMWRAFVFSFAFCWRSDRWGTVVRFVFSALSPMANFAMIYLGTNLISLVQANWSKVSQGDIPYPVLVVFAFLMLAALCFELLQLATAYTTVWWRQVMRYANRRELDEHFASLDVARINSKEFDELKRQIDELPMSWSVRIELVNSMLNLFGTLVSFVCFGLSLLWQNPIYGIVIVVTCIPLLVHSFKDTERWWGLNEDLMPVHKQRSVSERSFRGNTILFTQATLFGQFPWLRKEIDGNVEQVLAAFARVRSLSFWWGLAAQLVKLVGYVTVTYLAMTHSSAIGVFVLVWQATRTMYDDTERVVVMLAEQWQAVQAVIKIEEGFLEQKPLLLKGGGDTALASTNGQPIVLRNVTFAYPNTTTPVLREVTATIPPGAKVALVGPNGSGKSTLVSLLLRYYDPQAGGQIMFGNTALTEIAPAQLWRSVTALTQAHAIIPRRIGQEVASSRLGLPYDEARVLEAIRLADFAEDVAKLPHGLETQIGVDFGGEEFSGGQKQRLALARTLYALGEETGLLLLDEPEAALDPESAEQVIQNIRSLPKVTVVMVTHFVQRALDCDLVMVMEGGRLVEFGPPQEVVAQNGVFARLLTADTKRRGD